MLLHVEAWLRRRSRAIIQRNQRDACGILRQSARGAGCSPVLIGETVITQTQRCGGRGRVECLAQAWGNQQAFLVPQSQLVRCVPDKRQRGERCRCRCFDNSASETVAEAYLCSETWPIARFCPIDETDLTTFRRRTVTRGAGSEARQGELRACPDRLQVTGTYHGVVCVYGCTASTSARAGGA